MLLKTIKKRYVHDISNNRLISILRNLSKVFEKRLLKYMINFPKDNKFQFGLLYLDTLQLLNLLTCIILSVKQWMRVRMLELSFVM